MSWVEGETLDAEVLLRHCALRVVFADRALENVITECCGPRCASASRSPGRSDRWEITFYGPLTDLLPMMIRLQDVLPGRIEAALRIGVRLGTKPLVAHLTVEPDPD